MSLGQRSALSSEVEAVINLTMFLEEECGRLWNWVANPVNAIRRAKWAFLVEARKKYVPFEG